MPISDATQNLVSLLKFQDIDLQIESCRTREREIPKQKTKFDIYRTRLTTELEERDKVCKDYILEQRDCESEIEQCQEHIARYEQQLNIIKKNDEYQALLHEIDTLKKQISLKEERVLAIMMEFEDAQARLVEDTKRIESEMSDIDTQCVDIDKELQDAVVHREELEARSVPLSEAVEGTLLARYRRIHGNGRTGPVLVPLNDEVCGGCHMAIRAQMANEILGGEKIHTCSHCGRLLYHAANVPGPEPEN